MSYTLTTGPEWSIEDGRMRLSELIRDRLGPDRDRLRAFDVAPFVPCSIADVMQLEQRGFTSGAVVQIVGHLAVAGDDARSKVFRTMIPRCIAWSDLGKVSAQVAESMRQALHRMRVEESTRKLQNVLTVAAA